MSEASDRTSKSMSGPEAKRAVEEAPRRLREALRENDRLRSVLTEIGAGWNKPAALLAETARAALSGEHPAPETVCEHEWIEVAGKRGVYKPGWFCPKCWTGQRERPSQLKAGAKCDHGVSMEADCAECDRIFLNPPRSESNGGADGPST